MPILLTNHTIIRYLSLCNFVNLRVLIAIQIIVDLKQVYFIQTIIRFMLSKLLFDLLLSP